MRSLFGVVVLAFTLTPAACQPGGLSDSEQAAFRKELKRRYPSEPAMEPEPAAQPDAGAMPEPAAQPEPQPAMEPTPQPVMEPTPQPDATSGEIDPCVIEVFQSTCAGVACHYGSFVTPPDFGQDNLYEFLTTTTPPLCPDANTTFVNLDDPQQSYILLKIRGDQPARCGTVMPPTTAATSLSSDQQQCLEDWFASL